MPVRDYCFEAVQRPVHPSDRTKEPEPVLPEKRPVLLQLKPETDPLVCVDPLGLTVPELNWPERLLPEITNRSVAVPHGVPVATASHVPSKFPLPPPVPVREARRGSTAAGRFFRGGFSLSTAREGWREPDNDFSSLPMLPPALPDWASTRFAADPTNSNSDIKPVIIERKIAFCISVTFKYFKEKC
jgi:hypothetical protein